jgi:hypothetical protein
MRSMTPTSGTSPAPVLALGDMTSRDPSLAGANAAALATARAAGLPVLDGPVIPVDGAAQVAGAGNAEALPSRRAATRPVLAAAPATPVMARRDASSSSSRSWSWGRRRSTRSAT